MLKTPANTMRDTRKLRRQVAWQCFEPYLSENQRLDAIQILERGYQIDGAMNMISYVSKVCNEFEISEDTRKALYVQFHQLMTAIPESAIDPLPDLLEREQLRLSAKRQPEQSETTTPSAAAPATPQPISEPSATQRRELPAHTVIFSLLVHQILDLCGQTEALFAELKDLALVDKKHAATLIVLIVNWAEKPNSFRWAYDLDEATLTRLVHLLYTAVCEIVGPVEADNYFHKALVACEKRPEAKQFPPSKFL